MSLRPTFMGFETMKSALFASQKALDITGNNISNSATVGYSRQRVDVYSISTGMGGLRYQTSVSLAGQGIGTSGVTQLRDQFLDKRYRELNSDSAMAGTVKNIQSDIENVYNSLNKGSINETFANFKDALSQFSTDSADRVEMANVTLNYAEQLVQSVRSNNVKLQEIKDQTAFEMQTGVDRVSEIFRQLSTLNGQIKNGYIDNGDIFVEGNGYKVNSVYGPLELKDQRNNLLDELSNYGNFTVHEYEDGQIRVDFANTASSRDVNGKEQYFFTAVDGESHSTLNLEYDTTGAARLRMTTQGGSERYINVDSSGLSSGSLRGYLDMYNGAGVYADDILVRKVGMEENAQKLNDLLEKISSEIENTTPSINRGTIESFGEQLKKISEGIRIDFTDDGAGNITGIDVKLTDETGTDLSLLEYDGTTVSAYPMSVTVNDDGRGVTLTLANGSTVTFPGDDDGSFKKAQSELLSMTHYDSKSNGIVYYQKVLDAFANTLAQSFNTMTADNRLDPADQRVMFETEDGAREITAGNLKVSEQWRDDPMLIAYKVYYNDTTSKYEMKKGDYEELDPVCINKLQSVFKQKLDYTIDGSYINEADKVYDRREETLDDYIGYWENQLSLEISYTTSVYKSADSMAGEMSDSRDAVMGVSIDEEGTQMMTFQKWYNAAARMMTTLDEALDTIINNMGLVGR